MMLTAFPNIVEELRLSLLTTEMAAKFNFCEIEQSIEVLAQGVRRMQTEATRCSTCASDAGPALRTLRVISSLTLSNDSVASKTQISGMRQHEVMHVCDQGQGSTPVLETEFGKETTYGLELEAFVEMATPQLEALRADLQATTDQYNKLMMYLGEAPVDEGPSKWKVNPVSSMVPKAPPAPPTPAELFGAIESFTVGIFTAAAELRRKHAVRATKERSEHARRERLRHLQHRRSKHVDAGACDERMCLLNQIRMRRRD